VLFDTVPRLQPFGGLVEVMGLASFFRKPVSKVWLVLVGKSVEVGMGWRAELASFSRGGSRAGWVRFFQAMSPDFSTDWVRFFQDEMRGTERGRDGTNPFFWSGPERNEAILWGGLMEDQTV
jgi:hypothetical protein